MASASFAVMEEVERRPRRRIGFGTQSSEPAGLDCGANRPPGSKVRLAAPSPGDLIVEWPVAVPRGRGTSCLRQSQFIQWLAAKSCDGPVTPKPQDVDGEGRELSSHAEIATEVDRPFGFGYASFDSGRSALARARSSTAERARTQARNAAGPESVSPRDSTWRAQERQCGQRRLLFRNLNGRISEPPALSSTWSKPDGHTQPTRRSVRGP